MNNPSKDKQRQPTTRDGVEKCNRFFAERPPSSWSYQHFLTFYSSECGPAKANLANSRYLKALELIESSPTATKEGKKKARSLIDKHRNSKNKKVTTTDTQAEPSVVVYGDIIHAGQDVSITNGNRTVKRTNNSVDEAPTKRRIRARLSTPDPHANNANTDTARGGYVVHGDVVKAGGDVEIVNGERQIVETPYDESDIEDSFSDDGNHQIPIPTALNTEANSSLDAKSWVPPTDCNSALLAFTDSFTTMKNKYHLSSGRVLEDVIFHHVTTHDPPLQDNPIHQWVLDPEDPLISDWLEPSELLELQDASPPLPHPSKAFKFAVRRFTANPKNATTAKQLWHLIESSPHPEGGSYDRAKRFDATYVNSAAGLSMIESLDSCEWVGPQALREGWFGANVWGPLVDRCFHGIDNLVLSRTEIKSKTNTANKRFDAILLALAGNEIGEFGAIEVARTADAIKVDKRKIDCRKLVTVLQTMLKSLMAHVDFAMTAGRDLQVVAVQNVGFNIQVSRMSVVNANVFLLQRGHPRSVPTTLEKFESLFHILHAIIVVKGIVERSIKAITEYNAAKLAAKGQDRFEGFVL